MQQVTQELSAQLHLVDQPKHPLDREMPVAQPLSPYVLWGVASYHCYTCAAPPWHEKKDLSHLKVSASLGESGGYTLEWASHEIVAPIVL